MAELRGSGKALWHQGWYRFARQRPCTHWGARPDGAHIDLVLLHSISLPPGIYGGPEVDQLFTGQLDSGAHPYFAQLAGLQVSAHFFVRRGGELWQYVSCDARAWHAGRSQHGARTNCNDFSIGIELEGLEGQDFEAAQYDTLNALLPALAQAYPIAHVAGHEHVAPGRKHDPGAGFDWALLQKAQGMATQCFPEAVHAQLAQRNF